MSWPWALLCLLLLVLLLFWAVGAFKRLQQLRAAVVRAWQKVQEASVQRGEALRPLVAALREPLASEAQTLDQCLAALDLLAASQAAMNLQPLAPPNTRHWAAAEAGFAASASRISSLLDQYPDMQGQEPWQSLCAEWERAQGRMPFVRQLFGEAAGAYNTALAEFPTRWLTRLFRFYPAGTV